MAAFSAEFKSAIESARTPVCNVLNNGEHVVYTPDEAWSAEDVYAIQEALYPCDAFKDDRAAFASCMQARNAAIRLMGDPHRICWRSDGPQANRAISDRLDDLCDGTPKLLSGPGGEKKCEAHESVAEEYASKTKLRIAGEFAVGVLLGVAVLLMGAASAVGLFKGGGHMLLGRPSPGMPEMM